MEVVGGLFSLLLTSMIVKNVVLVKFLGMCPFLGVSKKMENAVGMGFAVLFVMILSSSLSWVLFTFVLVPLNLTFLKTIAFIILIASLVQLVEIVVKRFSPTLYRVLGIYLPLITTNCAVLGVALLNVQNKYSFFESLFYAIGGALGFLVVLILFSSIREKLELIDTPDSFKGIPVALITASFMSIVVMGFIGVL